MGVRQRPGENQFVWGDSSQLRCSYPSELPGIRVHEATFRSAGRGLRGAVASCGLHLLQCFTIQESPTRAENLRGQIAHDLQCFLGVRRHLLGRGWCRGFLGLGLPLPEVRMTLSSCRSRVWQASSVREGETVRFPEHRASTVWQGEARDSVCPSQLLGLNTRLGVLQTTFISHRSGAQKSKIRAPAWSGTGQNPLPVHRLPIMLSPGGRGCGALRGRLLLLLLSRFSRVRLCATP